MRGINEKNNYSSFVLFHFDGVSCRMRCQIQTGTILRENIGWNWKWVWAIWLYSRACEWRRTIQKLQMRLYNKRATSRISRNITGGSVFYSFWWKWDSHFVWWRISSRRLILKFKYITYYIDKPRQKSVGVTCFHGASGQGNGVNLLCKLMPSASEERTCELAVVSVE